MVFIIKTEKKMQTPPHPDPPPPFFGDYGRETVSQGQLEAPLSTAAAAAEAATQARHKCQQVPVRRGKPKGSRPLASGYPVSSPA
jgi:hypothetical protein